MKVLALIIIQFIALLSYSQCDDAIFLLNQSKQYVRTKSCGVLSNGYKEGRLVNDNEGRSILNPDTYTYFDHSTDLLNTVVFNVLDTSVIHIVKPLTVKKFNEMIKAFDEECFKVSETKWKVYVDNKVYLIEIHALSNLENTFWFTEVAS